MEGKLMKKLSTLSHNLQRRSFLTCTATFAMCGILVSTGCNKFIKRAQSPDDDSEITQFEDKSPVGPKYISETCGMWGMDYAKIEGIGLAMNLKGTGSPAKPGSFRDHLLDELKTHKDKISDPQKLCESKDTEMVIVRGYVPPGARKGDHFDVEIKIVPNMEGTSLDDGEIFRTRLRKIAQFKGRRLKEGLVVGLAEGPVLVDSVFETRQDGSNDLHGWILGGGETMDYRPLGLALRTQNYGPKTSTLISRAVNARFTTVTENGREGIANPTNYKTVQLKLPEIYRHNVSRFSNVMGNIRYNETAQERVERLDELGNQMTDPATCTLAALRLEAIGRDAVPTLKRSLNNPDLELRFRAAEALTYCGQSEGLMILKEVAETEPAFRWHAMTALSVSEDSDAAMYLEQLMQSESAETRYGAFRALHTRSPEHPLVYGRKFKDFFLHSVPVTSDPMVHFSRSKRPEIVVFGDARVSDDFLYVETGTTIRSAGTGKLKLIHYSKTHGREETICSTDVMDLVQTLSNHDFTYGRILRIFRAARKDETMVARLVVNAVPGTKREYDEDGPQREESNRYIAEAPPEMFRNGSQMDEKVRQRVTTDLIDGNVPVVEEKTGWVKFKDMVTGKRSEP
jgi:hypothetical protein